MMDSSRLREKFPRSAGSVQIMDTVSGRVSNDSVVSQDAFIQIPERNGGQRLENNAKPNHIGGGERHAAEVTCPSMDSYRSKDGVIQRYGSGHISHDASSDESLSRRKCRFIKKSGHCNVSHTHLRDKPQRFMADIFTTCVDLRWRWNLLLFSTAFIVSWLFFGVVYWVIAYAHGDFAEDRPESCCVKNLDSSASFTSAFLFSLETQTTIGYGSRVVTEKCPSAIITVVVQSIFGCVIDAFMIGLIMAKISRPKKRAETLLFSKNAVINVRDGRLCLMVRVGNLRKSHLVEATIRMQYLFSRVTPEGEFIPLEQVDLHLDLKNDSDRLFLVTPQTICHPIDSDSPLYQMDKETLKNSYFEIIIILEGMVEATGMTTQARASYLPGEILWGQRFENVITFSQTNGYHVNFKKFENTYVTDDMPTCSAAELAQRELMAEDGPTDSLKRRRSVEGGSMRTIRGDSSVSEGRDSGYTQEVTPPDSAETLDRRSLSCTRVGSASGGGSMSESRRSWAEEMQKEAEPRKSEEKLGGSNSLIVVGEKGVHRKKRGSAEIAAQITQERNLKNAALSAKLPSVPNQHNGNHTESIPVQNAGRISPDSKQAAVRKRLVLMKKDVRVNQQKDSVTPPLPVPSTSCSESADKTRLAAEPVLKSAEETTCLLGAMSPNEQQIMRIKVVENVPNGLHSEDSPV